MQCDFYQSNTDVEQRPWYGYHPLYEPGSYLGLVSVIVSPRSNDMSVHMVVATENKSLLMWVPV